MTGRGYFLPGPEGPQVPPPMPPPDPEPLVAVAALARMSPAELATLLAGALECQPAPVGEPSWMTPCSCGGLSAPARSS